MVETYCGKKCEECTYKEKLECSGCNSEMGGKGADTCEIAKCCKEKGHKECATCSYAVNCNSLRDRGNIPAYRLKDIAEAAEQKERNLKRTPFLGKWTNILFWLIVPGVIASLMTMDVFQQKVPTIYLVGEILNILVNISYGLVLFRLSVMNEHYRTSGICCLITAVSGALMTILPIGDIAALSLVLAIPMAVVSIFGEYHEYTGHAEGLREIDYEMSEKWYSLWKWYIGVNGAMIGGIVLMLLIPGLGALIVLGASIGVLVVEVLKLVYLYQTSKVFQKYN